MSSRVSGGEVNRPLLRFSPCLRSIISHLVHPLLISYPKNIMSSRGQPLPDDVKLQPCPAVTIIAVSCKDLCLGQGANAVRFHLPSFSTVAQ
jgi:hypothetical protein